MEPIAITITTRVKITEIEPVTADGNWVRFREMRQPIFFAAMPKDWVVGDIINITFERVNA